MGESTGGVGVLLGNQRRGIMVMMVPIAVALFVQQVNNLVDSLWVSDLGGQAMAALGVVYPIYCVLTGIGNGLGIGVSSAIARNIGMKNKDDADGVAMQGIVLTVLVSIALTAVLLLTARASMPLMGGADMVDACLAYAYPTYIMTFFIVLSGVLSGMLRGEGAAKRSMAIQVVGAVINIILDPILIFGFGMGIAGAAWATGISFVVSCVMAFWWYFKSRHMYITLRREYLRYDRRLQKEILGVGLPEALELTVMNFFNIFMNLFVLDCGGVEGLAVYTTSWRIAFMMIIPAQAIGGAIVAICSAEYGMGKFDMITDAFRFSIKVMFRYMVFISCIIIATAGFIASVFMHTDDLICMRGQMRLLMVVFGLFMPVFGLVYVGSSLMQALEKATQAMFNSLLRNIYVMALMAFATYVIGTLESLWWLLALGEVIGGITMLLNATAVLRKRKAEAAVSAEPQ